MNKDSILSPSPKHEKELANMHMHVIQFMRWRKPMAVISFIIVLIGTVSLFTKGLNLGLDFTGGIAAEVHYSQPVKSEQVVQQFEKAGFKEVVVQSLGSQQDLLIKMPPHKEPALNEKINQASQLPGNAAKVVQVDSVGSQVGKELLKTSSIAVVVALILMLLYVTVRFQFKFAVGAVISLVHDTLFTVGIFSLMGWNFDLSVLAAVLALIGYSLNDTIVVFDRIRENFRRIRGATAVEVVDISITETLRRTIMTVSTVVLVTLAMFFLGGAGLHWFSVCLLVGLIAGTYSSIYIATGYAIAMGLDRQDFLLRKEKDRQEDVVDMSEVL